ncbi:hypothetical protein [Streptomyces sp. NPDC056987]|uniref:hypothetical protein n=1 Tax=Streptomyces sp. NPDC056987 TaxID=3345988 RepID=UPI0036440F91
MATDILGLGRIAFLAVRTVGCRANSCCTASILKGMGFAPKDSPRRFVGVDLTGWRNTAGS